MVTSLRNAIKAVLGFKDDIAQGKNPTKVSPAQVGTYSKNELDAKLSQLLGNGDLPLSQYGDLGFSAPNVSSRYEGATTTHCPIAYFVEQDGSRNYLRNGMDGQSEGVYLCKLFVDANKRMTGYSAMATPWRPAWLPAADRIAELLHTAPGYVAMRCVGTYNGKLPAGSSYFAISWGNATLNPDLHTNFRVLTGLQQAGWEDRYMKGASTLVLDNNGSGGYLMRFIRGNPVRLEILLLTPLTAGTLTAATEVVGYTGTDCLGVTQNAAGQPVILATTEDVVGSGTAYFVRDAVEAGFGSWQTQPVLTVISHGGNLITLSMAHETWASRADGVNDRKVTTRQIVINFTMKTFSVSPNTQGPVTISSQPDGKYLIQGKATKLYETGMATIGNYLTGFSQCPRTGEVLVQSTQVGTGTCYQRYVPSASMWYSSWARDWASAQGWVYEPNYPSALGAYIGFPVPINAGLRIASSLGYADVLSPNYAAPIDYTYPDGQKGKWAVDNGRKVSPAWVPTRTMTVVPKSGPVRHVGLCIRGSTGYATVGEDGVNSGTWSINAAVDTVLINDLKNTMGADGIAETNFVCYRPGAIGHYVNPLVVIGYGINASGMVYGYTAVYEITGMSNGVVTSVSTAKVLAKPSAAQTSPYIRAHLHAESAVTSSMIIAEAADCVCICGSSPWNVAYVGNSGQPTVAVAANSSSWKVFAQYQAHGYVNGETVYFIPGKGPAVQQREFDENYAKTVMTMSFLGNTYATMGQDTGTRMVIATQAVYGSWNLYFSEEVRCQITGVSGKMPKKTVDLRTIKANPASTTFHLYATLTGDTFDYVISPTVLAADKSKVPIGTVVTNTTQIASVSVQKTFSIDGFSLSQNLAALSIPNSAGVPYSASAIINWPGVAV